jgi:hypothetical protein
LRALNGQSGVSVRSLCVAAYYGEPNLEKRK